MKKRFVIAALSAALMVSVAGCSSSNAAYLKNLKASSYVTPCDYVGITVEIDSSDYAVSETYVDYLVSYAVSSTSYETEVTDRDDVQDGDVVNIDYVGTLDGEEFDGGSYEGYELEIGSGTFIDGFEEGLIGCTVGETVDLALTFPEDYSSEDLAGQDVIFTVTINSIIETVTPEFTDEWVLEQGISGVETTDDFWQYYYDYLEEDAMDAYDDELESLLIDYVIENSTYKKDLPQAMVDRLTETITDYFQDYADYYGYDTLDEFMQYYYDTEEGEYEEYILERAEKAVRELLVMKAISDKEGLNPSKSEWQTQLSIYAAYYGYDSIDDLEEDYDTESLRENMMVSNVLDFLKESVIVVEPSEEEEEESDEETEDADEEDTEEAGESEEETDDESEEAGEDDEETEEEAESSGDAEDAEDEADADDAEDADEADADDTEDVDEAEDDADASEDEDAGEEIEEDSEESAEASGDAEEEAEEDPEETSEDESEDESEAETEEEE